MKNTIINCDTCKRDIKDSANSIDYRIAVINERIPSQGGAVTDMMIYPKLDRNFHFCSLHCLREWAKVI